jgi:hypothetical protein
MPPILDAGPAARRHENQRLGRHPRIALPVGRTADGSGPALVPTDRILQSWDVLSRYLKCADAGLFAGHYVKGRPMLEWEYITISLNDIPFKPGVIGVLNDAGKEGWELVAVTSNNIAYMKRQVAEAPVATTRRRTAAPREPR